MAGYELLLYNVHSLCPLSHVFVLCLPSFVPCLKTVHNVRCRTTFRKDMYCRAKSTNVIKVFDNDDGTRLFLLLGYILHLKVPTCEIFHLFDFNDFCGIKSL